VLRQARSHPDTDFVLLSRTGTQLSGSAIAKQVKRRAAAAGLYVCVIRSMPAPDYERCRHPITTDAGIRLRAKSASVYGRCRHRQVPTS
jgi:hypothetical protein